jgi:arginase
MTTILVPYHHDERLPDDSFPLSGDVRIIETALPEGDIWRRLTTLFEVTADAVSAGIATDGAATVVSGDCLAAIASFAGAQRAGLDPSIVWFDAHGDVHTLQTTTSGYLGGLALRLVLGAHPELLARPLGLRAPAEDRAVLVDARDLDPAERDYLASSAVSRRTVGDLDVDLLPDGPLVLHVDVDVVDAGELPGLRFPVQGGPSAGAVVAVVRRLVDTGRVAVLDLACPWDAAVHGDDQRIREGLLASLIAGTGAPA